MAAPVLDSYPGINPHVLKTRPTDIHSVYGQSGPDSAIATQPEILNRPRRQDFNQLNRTADKYNDTLITRTRMYVYRNANAIGAGLSAGNLNWTAAGPAKSMPTTRFNRNIRPIVGGGHSAEWGQHTNLETGQAAGNQLAGRSRMKPAGQNRLTVQRYRGQSFSASTQVV